MNKGITIDDHFVAKLKRGDEESFHRLYDQIAPAMRLVCRRYVKNDADAEDVFHEGFLKVYKSVRKLKNSNSFIGWMKRIFINTAIDHGKMLKGNLTECIDEVKESRMNGLDDSSDDFDDINYKSLTENECAIIRSVDFSQDEMLDALKLIPEHYRLVFQLFVIDEYKHQEIAELLSISEMTSKTRLLRGRGLLKKELCKLAIQKLSNGQDR
jgi:RNA polymerase sigma factor (sigma-70 family)